ncbi:MAG TPA: hypothetical protein VN524_04605, partial [Hyphomicrobiaceae bacterium]|nr:hypothetical protein [Hyphomicrobiaceae bacterium]
MTDRLPAATPADPAGFAFALAEVLAAPGSGPAWRLAISRIRRFSSTSLDLADWPPSDRGLAPPGFAFALAGAAFLLAALAGVVFRLVSEAVADAR